MVDGDKKKFSKPEEPLFNIETSNLSKPSVDFEKLSMKEVKGLQLKPAKQKYFFSSRKQLSKEKNPKSDESIAELAFNLLLEDIYLNLEERLSGLISSSGNWKSLELKGVLKVTLINKKLKNFSIEVSNSSIDPKLNIKIPPSFDKKKWSEGIVTLKEGLGQFSDGKPIETLKYGISLSSGNIHPPFKLTTWLGSNAFAAEIEFNPQQSLFPKFDKITLIFSVMDNLGATVKDFSGSEAIAVKNGYKWEINSLGPDNPSATLELEFKKGFKVEDILPIEIEIESQKTCLNFGTLIAKDEDDRPLSFKFESGVASSNLRIE